MSHISASTFAIAPLAMLCFASSPCFADDDRRFEITPLIGYRDGPEFDAVVGTATPDVETSESYGMALSMATDAGRRVELLYTFQPTQIQDLDIDLDIEHLHVGGKATYLESETMIPFIAGGIGATRFKADQGDDEVRFSGSLGLGVAWPVTQEIRIRLETRAYFVTMNSDSKLFCRSASAGGACLVRAAGDLFFQQEVLVGVDIGFGPRSSRRTWD